MRIISFAVGLLAALAGLLAVPPTHAASGAWALLTNEQVVAVEQKFAEALNDYRTSRDEAAEAEEEAQKKNRAEDKATRGLLGDLDQRTRNDIRRNNRKPKFPTEEDRIKENQRKTQDPDILKQRAERRKNLRELIAELDKPSDDASLKKYSKEYAGMLYEGFLKDPKKFSELAGEISAGEYGKLPREIEKASAALLTKAVGDLLEAYDYETTKAIWEGFTENVEDLQDAGSSLLRGDWEKFRSSLKELGKKKATEATEEAVKQAIGFAFGPLGDKAGSAYVSLVKAEITFLEWSDKTLKASATLPCLRRYVDTYNRIGGPGAPDVAYEEFKSCSEERGKFIGFAALEEYIVQNGLNADEIYRQLAEDYRLGNTSSAQRWLAELIESRKETVEAQWEKEFSAWSGRVGDISSRVNSASSIFINGLIEDVIGETALKEQEAAAAKALLDTFRDMQLLRRAADGAVGACNDFEDAKAEAAEVLKDAEQTDKNAEALEASAKNFAGCNADATAIANLKRLSERATQVNQDFERERKTAESEVDAACKAAEAVSPQSNEADARKQLDAANERAAAAKKAGEAAQAAFRELGELSTRAGEIKLGGDQAARDALAELVADAELINMARPALEVRFREAKGFMAAALRTAQNLEGFVKDQADKIKPVLAPYRTSTLRAQVLAIEDEIEGALEGTSDCRRSITDDWNKGEDGGVPWRAQKLSTTITADLLTAVDAAKARCGDVSGEDPAVAARAIADLAARAETEAAIVDLGKATYERCVAQAVTAYDGVRAAANAVLTMQAPILDDVKYWAGRWTLADGNSTQENYSGEYIYKGTYSWSPPPANVGPQGFSITMSATCEVGPKQGGLATGVGISAEGFDIVKSPGDRTPVAREETQAPANCGTGQSNSGSITVYVMPRASYSEGDVAKIKISAFWGPGVTYRYVAGKPKQ